MRQKRKITVSFDVANARVAHRSVSASTVPYFSQQLTAARLTIHNSIAGQSSLPVRRVNGSETIRVGRRQFNCFSLTLSQTAAKTSATKCV